MPAMPRIIEEGEGFLLVCPTPLPITKFLGGKKDKNLLEIPHFLSKHLHSKKRYAPTLHGPNPWGKNLKTMVGISSLNIARLGLWGIESRVFVFFCADLRFPYVFAKKKKFAAHSIFRCSIFIFSSFGRYICGNSDDVCVQEVLFFLSAYSGFPYVFAKKNYGAQSLFLGAICGNSG